ncbi:hypothetical protein DMB66_54025 [Actinoplanes sp. ATCC 53533]|nr:hypothetical protein DMB66_54025 [Actinoplanes sp. ATCC 53533]
MAFWLAVSFTLSGVALVAIDLVTLRDSEAFWPVLAAGLAMTLVGLLYFGPLPYLVVTETSVQVPMQLGSRRVTFGPRDRVDTGGRRLVVHQAGRPPRTIAYRGMARGEDWQAMATLLAGRGRDASRRRPPAG